MKVQDSVFCFYSSEVLLLVVVYPVAAGYIIGWCEVDTSILYIIYLGIQLYT